MACLDQCTGWLRIKYPTRQYAISPQPVVWFLKFLKLLNPVNSLNLTLYNVSWLRRGHGTACRLSRSLTSLPSLASFRRQLKTELLSRSFPDLDSSAYDRIWQILCSHFASHSRFVTVFSVCKVSLQSFDITPPIIIIIIIVKMKESYCLWEQVWQQCHKWCNFWFSVRMLNL